MQQKKLTQLSKSYAYVLAIILFSFLVNYHYSFIGVMPLDNFVLYNGGYRILKGYTPFNDYWLVTGPLLDYLNAFYFRIFDINWASYVSHSSTFNSIISLSTFYYLKKIGLEQEWSFFYSILFSLLMYPVVGTPFVDHHSTIFLVISFYLFIISVSFNHFTLLYFVPSLLVLSFLSKQTPAAYGIISISIITISLYFFQKKDFFFIFRNLIIGSIIGVILLFIFFLATGININNFIIQYILFSQTIGQFRLSVYDFNIVSIISQFKFIFFFISILIILLVLFFKDSKIREFKIITLNIILAVVLIFHQLITLNQEFIYFLIPLLAGVTHFYSKFFFKNRKMFVIFLILSFTIFSVTKYHIRFNENRKFNELENVDLSIALKGEDIHKSLKGVKWITYLFPNNPGLEIDQLKTSMDILNKENENNILITQYQFLAPALNIYDNSPNQWHHPSVSFPTKGQKYFNDYKNFFKSKVKKENIKGILIVGKEDENIPLQTFSEECFTKKQLDKIIFYYSIKKNCKDFE